MNEAFDTAVRMTKHGHTASEIATRLGVSKRTVQRWRHNAGIALPARNNTPVTEDRLAEAKKLLEDGASRSEVQRTLHMSEGTLHKYFPGCGWSVQQSTQFAMAVRRANQMMRELA